MTVRSPVAIAEQSRYGGLTLRVVSVAGAVALVSGCVVPQNAAHVAPRPVVPGVDPCAGIVNSLQSARVFEASVLAATTLARRKSSSNLCLVLDDAAERCFEDVIEHPAGEAAQVFHVYLGALPTLRWHVVMLHLYESYSILLVPGASAMVHELPEVPVESPDAAHLAVGAMGMPADYGPNVAQIYAVTAGELQLVWSLEPDDWAPGPPDWMGPARVRFPVLDAAGQAGGYLEVRQQDGAWRARGQP